MNDKEIILELGMLAKKLERHEGNAGQAAGILWTMAGALDVGCFEQMIAVNVVIAQYVQGEIRASVPRLSDRK